MKRKVRAAVLTGPREKIKIQEFPYPDLNEGAMLIKMEASGLCGSDKHAYEGLYDYTFPVILGHENVGRIVEITKEAKKMEFYSKELKEGDRVVICPDVVCGRCYFCRHGFGYTWCEKRVNYGTAFSCAKPPHLFGGWAEYMYVFPGSFVYKIHDDIPVEIAVLAENMAVTYSLDKLKEFSALPAEGFVSGSTVVVQGVGPNGLTHLVKTRLLGAGDIIAIDMSEYRLRMAKEFGADYLLNAKTTSSKERIQFVKDLTDGRGADLVIESAGSIKIVNEGISMLRMGGTYLDVGNVVNQGTIPFDPSDICWRSIRYIGQMCLASTGFIPSVKLMMKHKKHFPFEKIITHRFKIEESQKALETSFSLECMKVVITP
jgi:L-iditol 2-dehydrogenase